MLFKWLLIIFVISIFIKEKYKVKEEYTILISNLLIFLLLYLFGVLNQLRVGVILIYLITAFIAFYLIYLLIRKKISIKDFYSNTYLIYLIGSIFLFVLTYSADLTDWDEFSHWGTNLKAMVSKDILWGNSLWEGVHEGYPPLAGIIEYFGCKLNGGYQPWIGFLSLDLFMLSLISPVFSKNIIKNIIYLSCIYMLVYFFNFKLTSLYIDLPLGILFFIGFYISTIKETKQEKFVLSLIFISLPLFKDSGLIFSAIIFCQLLIKNIIIPIFKKQKVEKKLYLNYLFYLLLIFGAYFSWKIYCNLNGTGIDFMHDSNAIMELNLSEYIRAVFLRGTGKPYDIAISFYTFINTSSIVNRVPYQTIIGIITSFDIILIILYLINKKEKDKYISIFASLNLGAILYLLFLLMIFIYAFLEPEGRSLASFPRYISTFLIAWAILLVTLSFKNKKWIPIIISLLICLSASNIVSIIKPVSKGISVIPDSVYEMADKINSNMENSKVFIVLQQDDGYKFHTLRYLISPNQTNLLYEWNLGPTNKTSSLATIDISKEEWLNKLKKEKFEYVYLGILDEQFMNIYGDLFEETNIESLQNSLYKIKIVDDKISFIKV